jgi:endoglucanase
VNEDVTVTTRRDSTWQTGHCDTVSGRNEPDAPLDWSIELMIDGTLNDHWNSNASGESGTVTFTGADWNRTIAPGASAEFGYCVSTAS